MSGTSTLPGTSAAERAAAPPRRWWRHAAYLVAFWAVSSAIRRAPAPATPAAANDGGRVARWPPRLRWWRELVYILAFYALYSAVRNTQGSAAVSAAQAMANALDIIRWEEMLGIYWEQSIQQAFLGNRLFIGFWNVFYGSFHFIVTAGALILLFRRFPDRYRRWRNTLAFTTALALVGFALYPLMPPRLLPPSFGYVDTLRTYGGLWSFDSTTMQKLSNQYAAMPSLHFAWSAWSALVLISAARTRWAKALAAAYPVLTLFAIVVTANHFILDAAGGALVLAVGALLGFPLAARMDGRDRRLTTAAGPAPPLAAAA